MSPTRLPLTAAVLAMFTACADGMETHDGELNLIELRPTTAVPSVQTSDWDLQPELDIEDIEDIEDAEEQAPMPPPAGVWALPIIEVAEPDDSFDVDGDGYGDNALADILVQINSLLAEESRRTETMSALSAAPTGGGSYRMGLCTLDATMADLEGQADVYPGEDMASTGDCDHMSNMSSDAEGIFGSWDASIPVGSFLLDIMEPSDIDAMLTQDRAQLFVGGVIAVDPLAGMLRGLGNAGLADQVYGLADVDGDGDGVSEGISVTFLMAGLKVEVVP